MIRTIDDVMLCTESFRHRQREVNTMDLRHAAYDGDLEMFVEPPRDPDMGRLLFLRWLVERRRLEHGPAGAPCGDFVAHAARSDPSTDELKAA
jgi:hypothetical protein